MSSQRFTIEFFCCDLVNGMRRNTQATVDKEHSKRLDRFLIVSIYVNEHFVGLFFHFHFHFLCGISQSEWKTIYYKIRKKIFYLCFCDSNEIFLNHLRKSTRQKWAMMKNKKLWKEKRNKSKVLCHKWLRKKWKKNKKTKAKICEKVKNLLTENNNSKNIIWTKRCDNQWKFIKCAQRA